jgi:hypothetical protein
MFLQEDRLSANASTARAQLTSVHASREWIELHIRMGYLRDELNRAGVGDDEGAVETYRQISLAVDRPRTKSEFVHVLSGSSEKDRMSAIRELGSLFDRAQGDDNRIAVLRRLLLEIGTDAEAPPNLVETFLHAQLTADLLDSAAASLLCAQVGLSEDQARRMMGSLISKRFTNSSPDWEIRRMYDLSLQLMASHVGHGDAKAAAYVEAILNGADIIDRKADPSQVIRTLIGFLPDGQVTDRMLDSMKRCETSQTCR